MAKADKAISIIPYEKQPHPLPGNWCWVSVDSINQYKSGSIDPTKQPDSLFELYSVPSSTNDYPEIVLGSEVGSTKQTVEKGDVLLCKINPRINRVWKVTQHTNNTLLASSEWIIIRNRVINPDYLMYCFKSPYFREYMLSNVSGVGGSLMRAQPKYVKNYPIPLPPLAEQHRIVSRIESLFAKLDEAKENAQAVVDGFDDRKAAILTKGILGDLTDTWRQNNGLDRNKWRTVNLSEVCQLQTGIMKGKHFQTETIMMPYLRVANVQDGFLNLQEIKIIEVEKSNFQRYLLQDGDVLFTEGGDYDKLGRGTVWHCEIPDCLHQNHVFVVRPVKDILISEYLSYQAGSQYGKRYFLSCSKQTTNLASINSTQLKQFPTLIPSLAEQKEIVYVIDRYINKEQRAKEAAEQIISQIDIMKKSILARAFRGELGTNDPSDKSAEELLKQIL